MRVEALALQVGVQTHTFIFNYGCVSYREDQSGDAAVRIMRVMRLGIRSSLS